MLTPRVRARRLAGLCLPTSLPAPSYTLQIRQLLVALVSANFCLVLTFPYPFHSPNALLNPRPAFVFLQALHSPRATLQPSWRVPIVSVRRLVRLSLAFTRLCHSCLPDTRLLFVLDSPPWPDKRHKARGCVQLAQVLLALMSALRGTCSPHRTCHACLPATYYVLLLPFPRASAICVCAKSHARCPSTS